MCIHISALCLFYCLAAFNSFLQRRYDMNGRSQIQEGKNWILPQEIYGEMQTGSSETLIGWKSGKTTYVPVWDRMEGAWQWTLGKIFIDLWICRRGSLHRADDDVMKSSLPEAGVLKKLSLAGLAKLSRLRYSWLRFGLASAGYGGLGVHDRSVYTAG